MRHGVILLAMLALSVQVSADPLTFKQAKSRADTIENALGPSDMQRLVSAQARLASNAFPRCVERTGSRPTNFTVVVQLDGQGVVINSWRQGNSPFARCFQKSMEGSFTFQPKAQPFFTAFEYANAH